jgi:flagellar biosynthesis/type III secretory pathway M-ring protein FliF/YscJ
VTESTTSTEGFLAFLAFALLAVALWFLMRNMNARMRRMSYRQQAAHRGKDEPQAGPEDLRDEADGDDADDFVGDDDPRRDPPAG